MAQAKLPDQWKFQKNPPGITRSYEFASYQDTSKFLEELAELSEKMNFYPNLNFTRTQVNVNIDIDGKVDDLDKNQIEYDFAVQAESLKQASAN